MKLYLFTAGRAIGVLALKAHLALDCKVKIIDFRRGDQRTPQYLALNPNRKMQTLEDDGFVLWASNTTWRPTLDNRTRPDHADMDGYGAIPLDEKFVVGGYEMDRPGDAAGPASEVISCRCVCTYGRYHNAPLFRRRNIRQMPSTARTCFCSTVTMPRTNAIELVARVTSAWSSRNSPGSTAAKKWVFS
jgi:hypothetical protein